MARAIQFNSIQFNSIQFNSIQFNSFHRAINDVVQNQIKQISNKSQTNLKQIQFNSIPSLLPPFRKAGGILRGDAAPS